MKAPSRLFIRARQGCSGFTMVELMVTVSIIAIVAAIATPSYRDYIANQQVKNVAQDLYFQLIHAKSEAILRNSDVYLTNHNTHSNWESGWIITGLSTRTYTECENGSDNCIKIQQPQSRIVIETYLDGTLDNSIDKITYNRNGRLAEGRVAFEICGTDSSVSIGKRIVTVTLSGQPKIDVNGTCP